MFDPKKVFFIPDRDWIGRDILVISPNISLTRIYAVGKSTISPKFGLNHQSPNNTRPPLNMMQASLATCCKLATGLRRCT